MQNNPYSQYKETQVKTANQGKLIVMMYDGAVKFIKTALENLPSKKYDIVNTHILKAQDVINELMLAINFEAGDFAEKLYALYVYMNRRLVEGNIQKNSEPLEEVLGYLLELKSSWEKISNLNVKSNNDNDIANQGGINIST